jgi:hypothetical protein
MRGPVRARLAPVSETQLAQVNTDALSTRLKRIHPLARVYVDDEWLIASSSIVRNPSGLICFSSLVSNSGA